MLSQAASCTRVATVSLTFIFDFMELERNYTWQEVSVDFR
jgi:hypothetical protein